MINGTSTTFNPVIKLDFAGVVRCAPKVCVMNPKDRKTPTIQLFLISCQEDFLNLGKNMIAIIIPAIINLRDRKYNGVITAKAFFVTTKPPPHTIATRRRLKSHNSVFDMIFSFNEFTPIKIYTINYTLNTSTLQLKFPVRGFMQ
jgi:hypothetical protein